MKTFRGSPSVTNYINNSTGIHTHISLTFSSGSVCHVTEGDCGFGSVVNESATPNACECESICAILQFKCCGRNYTTFQNN